MRHKQSRLVLVGCAVATGFSVAALATAQTRPEAPAPLLTLASGRISIAGTSNIHAYTASTTEVRVVSLQVARTVGSPAFWDEIVAPGAVEAFEIAIPAATLSSPAGEGLDKNMHKALKVAEHPDITFRLTRLETGTEGSLKALGILRIAGVERDVALDLATERTDSGLTVRGELHLLMTDYGIKPPRAMLGMLKTDPKVTVSFEAVLRVPVT